MAGHPPFPSRPFARAVTVAKWNFCGRNSWKLFAELAPILWAFKLLLFCPFSLHPCLSGPPPVSWVLVDAGRQNGVRTKRRGMGMSESLHFWIENFSGDLSIFLAESFIHSVDTYWLLFCFRLCSKYSVNRNEQNRHGSCPHGAKGQIPAHASNSLIEDHTDSAKPPWLWSSSTQSSPFQFWTHLFYSAFR